MSYSGPRNSNVRLFQGGINALEYWIGNRLLSASDIVNDSSVTGSSVKTALNTLSSTSSAVFPFVGSGLAEQDLVSYDAGASTWKNRTVAAALSGKVTSTMVSNSSSVSGATVTAALNTLDAKTYAASQVTNDSSVSGSSVKDALDTLTGAIPNIGTLVASGTITPGTYATTTTTMSPASLVTFTPTAGKIYRMEIYVIGNLTSGAAQVRLQLFVSSGSGTYTFCDTSAGLSSTLPVDFGNNDFGGTSVYVHYAGLIMYIASSSSLILGVRVKNSTGSINYSLALGQYKIYEIM